MIRFLLSLLTGRTRAVYTVPSVKLWKVIAAAEARQK